MDKTYLDIFHRVGEAAELAVLTLTYLVWVAVAELSLVLFLVVQSLDTIVRPLAPVAFRALLGLSKLAKLWCVLAVFAPSILE